MTPATVAHGPALAAIHAAAYPPGEAWAPAAFAALLAAPATSGLIDPRGGPRVVKEYSLRVYTCAELAALLRRHGLAVREVWGGADREPYTAESRRLVLLSERGA